MSKDMSYAEGGEVLGRTHDFLKEPVRFRQQGPGGKFVKPAPEVEETLDTYGKGMKGPPEACDAPPQRMKKSLKPVLPRK
jgi:hypothetical protein